MDSYSRIAVTTWMLVFSGVSTAQQVDGNWLARVQRGGGEHRYEVDIARRQDHFYGNWSVETFKPSAGCFIGEPRGGAIHFRTCTTDGSAGTRNMEAVCPEYHKDRNRFVLKSGGLAWEVWDEKRRTWSPFVQLQAADQKGEFLWSEKECGKP